MVALPVSRTDTGFADPRGHHRFNLAVARHRRKLSIQAAVTGPILVLDRPRSELGLVNPAFGTEVAEKRRVNLSSNNSFDADAHVRFLPSVALGLCAGQVQR